MVFFWVNNRSFDIFNFFLEEYGTKGPLPKESVLQLALAFKEHGIREFDLNEWCQFSNVMTLFPEDQSIILFQILQSFAKVKSAFIDIHYFVVMLFVLSYDPYRHDESMDYTSIFKRCGTEQVISEDTLPFDIKEQAEMIHRSSYVYDNLLILFITLFYEDITSHPLSEIIEHAVNSDYSFFLDGLVITPESLRYLSYVLCAGESLGEEQPFESLFPSSMLCDSEYNVFDLIVFIERNMVQVSLSDRMKHAKVNGERFIVNHKNEELLVTSSIITPAVLIIKNIKGGMIEDGNNYSYPI
ncbi:hypothetical protein JH06_4688 [Blastocystis sp. subtype 4]|uniref:hypothetical protein n=1 Tax=Blastocystis sp. subtype 4 TaxID=944170 RepID=UPI0007114083|nr:hypothetical protein JH06_4688 [Blastocystis sp. subtype 4]KNB41857.1 hypothetical protein JH06_4688 [Blastocystis sp. subtype 4]|eukprot:XP_014525300.1 hypothetical protein JH06_4688 [Blastocystis sp. subtype 4]